MSKQPEIQRKWRWPFCGLVTRRSIDLMAAMIQRFQGNAHLSLEGDLSLFRYDRFPNVITEPSILFPRNTLWPPKQFAILALNAETIPLISRHVLPCVGIRDRVLHILIEQEGEIVFAAYDRFDPDLVGVINTVEKAFLDDLVSRRVIRSYCYPPHPDAAQ